MKSEEEEEENSEEWVCRVAPVGKERWTKLWVSSLPLLMI